eukprot:TRINITY_DN123302_c0_g1_i1.p1 TRINITY_DN123302_c0_g1~~TRINITY_DN123302_c0_g1_i1.p1  ORF type:complete len:354 (-),score=42.01 TRINITY_DN123302_c0_g1_i1:39-1010(-)
MATGGLEASASPPESQSVDASASSSSQPKAVAAGEPTQHQAASGEVASLTSRWCCCGFGPRSQKVNTLRVVRRVFNALTPRLALAGSHLLFIFYFLAALRWRWWLGSKMSELKCQGTLPYICWLSECINGTYGPHPMVEDDGIIFRSRLWVALAVCPAFSATWLLASKSSRPLLLLDVGASVASWAYLLIGLVPDIFVHLRAVHLSIAAVACLCGILGQLLLRWRCKLITFGFYGLSYIVLSEVLILSGAPRSEVYNWRSVDGEGQLIGGANTYVRVILEWVAVFGAGVVCIVHCLAEERLRQPARAARDSRLAESTLPLNCC